MNRIKGIRKIVAVAACSVATGGGMAALAATADAAAPRAAAASSIVPAPGAPTAFGYTALVRHATGANDNQGTLVLRAADGRYVTIGQVSDSASVMDVSSNARTVVTGFFANSGAQLRLTMWDAESKQPTFLRVDNGASAALVSGGIVVSRHGAAAQLYSRSGQLLRTYSGAGQGPIAASADGTRVFEESTTGSVVVRTASTGAVQRTVPKPAGTNTCTPDRQYGASELSMTCAAGPGQTAAYRAGFTSGGPTLIDSDAGQAMSAYKVNSGFVYSRGSESVCPPAYKVINGVRSAVPAAGNSNIAGAWANSVDLFSDCSPSTAVRVSLSTGQSVRLAGPGTAIGGIVTSAKTVDGT